MRVTIYTSDRGTLDIADFAQDSLLELLEAWRDESQPLLQVNLDETSVTYLARQHVVRIDVD